MRFEQTQEQDDGGFAGLSADLRAYRQALGGVLAGRLWAGVVEEAAPFYDRIYLGGLYTVRGVPSQSLSAAQGGTWGWVASCEYRAALAGAPENPRLVGSLFADVARGGDFDITRETAASLGWGVRLRLLPGLWLGADVAAPIKGAPVDEAFHGHVALGWNF